MARTSTQEKTPATLSVGLQKVTPAQARRWLADNDVNRKPRPALINAYRRDMEADRWKMTAEPIQLSRTGRLLNGQHRLIALSTAKVHHIDFVVATGLDDRAQAVMDQGKSRTIKDALSIEHGHVKNVTLVGAVCRWLTLVPELGPHMTQSSLRGKVTVGESMEIYDKYQKEINIACREATVMRQFLPGSPSAIAYTYFQFMKVDVASTAEFFAGMKDMNWAWKEDPRKAAWRRMNAIHRDNEIKTSLDTGVMLVSVMSRAWNAWRRSEALETILARTRNGIIAPVKPL